MFFDPKLLKSASFALSLATQAIVLTFVGFFLGQWIDVFSPLLPTFRWYAFSGFIIGMYNLLLDSNPTNEFSIHQFCIVLSSKQCCLVLVCLCGWTILLCHKLPSFATRLADFVVRLLINASVSERGPVIALLWEKFSLYFVSCGLFCNMYQPQHWFFPIR